MVAVLAVVLASLIAYLVGRRLASEPLRTQLAASEAREHELTVSAARLEARLEGAVAESERLQRIETQLKAALALADQERTRSDHELRQIGLAASRVPELEQQVAQLDALREDLASARAHLAELGPVAEELELRNQFIESLQRELSYRDERGLALERRVDQLGAVVSAIETARASLSAGRDVGQKSDPGRGRGGPDTSNAPPSGPSASGSGRSAGRQGAEEPQEIDYDDDDPDRPPAPIGRALEQALHGLGVSSFADLGIFDHIESSESE
jgi:flagellar biosynthesis chaperone FliJ